MAYLAATLIVVTFVIGGVVLALHNHLWLAFFCLIAASGIGVTSGKDDK